MKEKALSFKNQDNLTVKELDDTRAENIWKIVTILMRPYYWLDFALKE